MRVNGHTAAFLAKRLWRFAIFTAVGAIGIASQAEAALYYWSDSDPALSRPGPTVPPSRQGKRRHPEKKAELAEKESAKPQGPLIISISIAQQRMRVYDANGFFAETPISTGMPGHPTPMGVFSVIQKHKLHHSNIYSGAPMPYMQRITWSGVAMHAGVLPGHPASHGCIRMPMAFAVKMWNWTKMGARVVVTPGEITPVSFSHPLLAALKVPPQPIAAAQPNQDAPAAANVDKTVGTDANTKPVISEAVAELRPTLGHDGSAKPAADETPAPGPSQTRTADASAALPAANLAVTMSDAAPASRNASPAASSDDKVAAEKTADAKSSEVTSAEIEPAKADAVDFAEKKADEAAGSPDVVAVKIETVARENIKADAPTTAAPKAIEKPSEKPDQSAQALVAPAAIPEAKKDQSRPTDVVKAAVPKPDPAWATALKRAGQIAVFVSRKDSKLYVRQNFAPLFEVPVTIAPSDRPLGTHVFTAQVDKGDANVLHWSVVSLPAPARNAVRRDEDERSLRRRKIAGAGSVEVKPLPVPDSPAEALDRLTLPADTMARITEALSTAGSIIVSDQGIAAGETGEGTDFIVSLR
ncbi:MAG: L,D-transpeptidase [Bradyrhizobium sp.]|nr:MAG: L,D-transpeptidase [Bradyrhizobium sp.]